MYFIQHRDRNFKWSIYRSASTNKNLIFTDLSTTKRFAKTTSYNKGARVITVEGDLVAEYMNEVQIYP